MEATDDLEARPAPDRLLSDVGELERAILDNVPALIAYWDRDLRNRLANQAYVDYFGLTPDEVRGRHIRDVLGPKLFEMNEVYMRRALAGERQDFDREIPTPTGLRYTQASYVPDVVDGEVRGFFVLVTDITARRKAEQAQAQAEARFRTLFNAAPVATVLLDSDDTIVAVNTAAVNLLGRESSELVGMLDVDLTYPDDVAASRERIARLWRGELTRYTIEKRYVHALGHPIWTQADATLIEGAGDDKTYVLKQLQDVGDRRRHEEELEYLADHDALTGLLNRRGLFRELERQAAQVQRYGNTGALLVIDLDHFKNVNDTLGHKAGDELIARVSDLLLSRVRATDVVARLGGDEFAVLLPRDNLAEARKVGESIVALVRAELASGPLQTLPVTASLGIAEFRAGLSADEVLASADLAMYDAKEAGRDQVSAYRQEGFARPKIEARINWVTRIRHAIDNDRLRIASQTIHDSATGRTALCELLIRILDEDGEIVGPASFLYIAERFDLVQHLDRFVIENAAALLADPQRIPESVSLTVNVSARTIAHGDIVGFAEKELRRHGADPRRLVFEITETAAIAHIHDARAFAHAAKDLGSRIAIDDFGAGFGSFYYLKNLPFDFLKIDGEFVTHAPTSPADALIVRTVRDLARGLGGEVIAEFCTDPTIANWLNAEGINLQQGYLHSRPTLIDPLPHSRLD